LPYQIKALFLEWLQRHFPERAAHVESLIRQSRGGELYDSRLFVRGKGEGAFADQLKDTFKLFATRYGLAGGREGLNNAAFRRPGDGVQLGLWG
jgi:hypothetical protein